MKKWLCLCVVFCLLSVLAAGCGGRVPNPDGSMGEADSAPVAMTADQLTVLQAFLDDGTNNGFVCCHYSTPAEVTLDAVFYDGAGVGTFGTVGWSEQEQQDVLAATGWDEFFNPPLKIPRAQVEQILADRLGLTMDQMQKPLSYCYVEAYDAYYTMHGDTGYTPVTVLSAQEYADGRVVAEYRAATFGAEKMHVLTLQKTEDGYRFVSNLEKSDGADTGSPE